MPTHLDSVVIDTADPAALARWWAQALGWTMTVVKPVQADVEPESGSGEPGVRLVFYFADDPRTVKNRLHLDLRSDSAEDQAGLVRRLTGIGAVHRDIGQGRVPWTVLADPHGNELCVLDPRDLYSPETGPIAAVVVDAVDPAGLARFWADAAGWTLEGQDGAVPRLRHPAGSGPFIEFVPTGEPHRVKNRVHLDVAPGPGGDQAAEVERLIGLGAERVEIGQSQAPPGQVTWVVLADPEGNEFCVLTPR